MTRRTRHVQDALLFTVIVLLERAVIVALFDISPNPDYVTGHWQHLPLDQLRDDLWGSILTLHSQGPLWNFVLGVFSILCDGAASCVARGVQVMNLAFTLVMAGLLLAMVRAAGVGRAVAFPLVALFAALPSTIYYEFYAFYPHLTLFLITVSLFFALRLGETGSARALLGTVLPIVLLGWTWGIFHPFIMFAAIATLLVVNRLFSARHLLISAAACLLLLLPSIKNASQFGFFGGSSWLGLNISQVAPQPPEHCTFYKFMETRPEIEHPGAALNHPSIIPYAADCQRAALASILSEPVAYAKSVIRRTKNSMQNSPSDYFFPPQGFEAYPRWTSKPYRNESGRIALTGLVTPVSTLVVFAAILAAPFVLTGPFRSPAVLAFYFFVCVVVVGHLANGAEQERFRYSLNTVSFFVLSVGALRAGQWVLARR